LFEIGLMILAVAVSDLEGVFRKQMVLVLSPILVFLLRSGNNIFE
jgi:hypothetical protein